MLRFGPEGGPVVVLALPLFEEANRTRWLAGAVLRALAAEGIAGVLPDLPGQGESVALFEDQTILSMQVAYAGLIAGLDARCYGVGIRSGALLDALGLLSGRWHLAPQDGPALLRELARLKQRELGSARLSGEHWWRGGMFPQGEPVPVGGNAMSGDLLTELTVKKPFDQPGIPRRVVRLASDTGPADRKIDGAPPWRRAEPGDNPVLAQLLAADIVQWVRACEGF